MKRRPRPLLSLFDHPAPGLVLCELDFPDDVSQCRVEHRKGAPIGKSGLTLLQQLIPPEPVFDPLRAFYAASNGADVCRIESVEGEGDEKTLLELLPVESWRDFSADFEPGGERAWVVDDNQYRKVRTLYREEARWVAFGRVGDGGALTTFTTGDGTGSIFFLSPESRWNIARPLFRDFGALGDAMVTDLGALLRRIRAVGPDGLRIDRYVEDAAQIVT